jgi:glutamine synthetase
MVEQAPRTILKRQLERLSALGYSAYVGTELEFIVFKESYEEAWNGGYRQMTPVNLYNVDYSLLGTGRIEPLLYRIRNEMSGAGMSVESVKGECNFGQHELAFKYTEALEKADEHALFKLGAKEIASQEGYSLTFMAKYNEREGNSCHIHMSLRDEDGTSVFQDNDSKGPIPGGSKVFEHFLAGQLATLSELSLLFAPNINSYKRYVKGSFAPTAVAWGIDNRTCAFRVVGHGPALRLENRIPGGDVNPYLAIAAMIAGGLHGIENELELPARTLGNAYVGDAERVPSNLKDAAESFANSAIARAAFGQEVVDHYLNMAEIEISAFEAAVTDWERFRSFERL